jgi:hypothetical protein
MSAQPDVSRLYERPLARAHALAETWDGDHTTITRHEAAELLNQVLNPAGWTQTEPPTANLAVVPTAPECGWRLGLCAGCPQCTPEPDFGAEGCTCRPFTHQDGSRYLDQPGDTVDMISGWEIGDCPHHKRPAPAVGEQPHA